MKLRNEEPADVHQALNEAHEKLKLSQDRFHTLFGLAMEGIVIISAENKPTYISPSIKKVMGYSEAELQQLSLGSLVHPDDLAAIQQTQAKAIGNPGVPFEYPISRRRNKDGSWRWVEATITNLLNDPSIGGIVTQFRDVTDRKLAQDKVLENAHKYRTLIEQSVDGIAILSAEGTPNYLSPAVTSILGFTQEEAMTMNLSEWLHPEDLPGIEQALGTVLKRPGQSSVPIVARVKHKNGQWRWVESTLTNMIEDPVIGGIVDNFRDITERIEYETRLRYSNRLYNFISQINQTIVHVRNEQALFDAVCRIAIDYGKFEFAWIAIAKNQTRQVNMQAAAGATDEDFAYFENYTYQPDGPLDHVFQGQDFFVVAEIEKRANLGFNAYAARRGFKSAIFFAIKKGGKTIGTFNLYSSEKNFFNLREISLLKEASADISFALDVFDNDIRRTQAERALRHKELRLSQAQAIAHVGNWEFDFTSQTASWSDEALRIYGLPAEQRIQSYDTWFSHLHPDDANHITDICNKAIANRQSVAFHHRIVRKGGEVRYLYSQLQPECRIDGTLVIISGVAHDITDLKLAEATALKAAGEKIEILESIRDAFFAVDDQWIVTYWNKEAARFTGTTKDDILGRNLWDLFPDSVNSLAFEKYSEATTSDKVVHFEDYFELRDLWYEASAYPSAGGLSVFFKDITTRKHAETERIEMINNIVQRNKDLEQFSYIVSHNLRAPVANIKGLAQELNEGLYPPEITAMLKRELSSSINRLDEVIIDLNGILQLKREVFKNNEYVGFSDLIDSIKMGIINLIDAEHVRIETDFRAVEGLTTIKSYLYSIFYNLISNSIKYRHPDRPPHIVIKSTPTPKGILVEFRDNGVGINLADKKDQVFRLYKRFHQHVEGKGIGLFMVKTQAEMLNAKIEIESAVNQGTNFRIEFSI